MLSLRSVSRAVSRSACRIASQTPRPALRPAFPSIIRAQPSTQIPRCFSAIAARRDATSQELAAKLQQELSFELEGGQSDSDSHIAAFKEQNPDWNVEDKDGEQEVLLHRKFDDETITISFSIADFSTPAMLDEADEAFGDEEDDMDGQSGGANSKGAINQGRTDAGNIKVAPEDRLAPADREELRDSEDDLEGAQDESFAANVNVLIQREGKGALRLHLIADAGVFSIQSVAHIPDNKLTSNATAAELLRESFETLYSGPPFQQLDEDVQSNLEAYLDARGINTALALFVPEYIDTKEQKEYLGWLNRVKEFVE